MKVLLLLLVLGTAFGQVGINTTDPQAMLDINGDLIIRDVPADSSTDYLVVDTNGKVGKRYAPGAPFGFYRETKFMDNAIGVSSPGAVSFTSKIAPLNLPITITLASGQTHYVEAVYDIPALLPQPYGEQVLIYMGVTFYRNNVEMPNDSRKFNMDKDVTVNTRSIYRMINCTYTYFETVTNNTGSPITITYEPKGYAEFHSHVGTSPIPVPPLIYAQWGMWAASGENYNIGKGRFTVTVLSF